MSEHDDSQSRNSEIHFQFMKLLKANYANEHSVQFYADALHITPRHLTSVLKAVGGKTTNEWIDEYRAIEIKMLLRYSTLTISEICDKLYFPTNIAFSSFFKRITGIPPSEYRKHKNK
jgi:AraC-like DNA-binding protein